MSVVEQHSPRFSEDDAAKFAERFYGIRAAALPLPSYLDQNFHLTDEKGREFVLKIANASEGEDVLDLQNRAMDHLAVQDPSLLCPRVLKTKEGLKITSIEGPGRELHFVRLVTYLPGVLFADVNPHSPGLLASLGQFLGRMDLALEGFSHPAASRVVQWDLKNAAEIIPYLEHIEPPERRALARSVFEHFRSHVALALPHLRQSAIHNDGNDYNLLVNGPDSKERVVTGILDFGDMVRTCTVFELAVALAYAVLGEADPLEAGARVVRGYHDVYPLAEKEIELLFPLLCTRLATSVTLSANRRKVDPHNAYLDVTEEHAWEMLKRLETIPPALAHYTFRHACGLPACSGAGKVEEWLTRNPQKIGPVLEQDLSTAPVLVFDLSVGSLEISEIPDRFDLDALENLLCGHMKQAGAEVGIGRYDEPRRFYTGPPFRSGSVITEEGRTVLEEGRTVHLGVDLFAPPSSTVFSPLDGKVHSFRNNRLPLDYGPTLVLEHEMDESLGRFYTLYGHLSEDALTGLKNGLPIKKGDAIGRIGKAPSNGNWPPHLHFQIICDLLGQAGDFPGVSRFSQKDIWLSICPDPNLLLKVPEACFPHPDLAPEEILEKRRQRLGTSLSASYENPLKIVRGARQYLYDHTGRAFLDCVNNVCHVGHSHPKVVEAARRQMAVLNTNTRYLHDELVRYAERLTSFFPDPLKVCFFVCSGSEANELALRLAKTYTGAEDLIVLDGAYHGNTSSLVDLSPYKFDGPGGKGAPPQVHKVIMPDGYRGPFKSRDPESGKKYAIHVQEAVDRIKEAGKKPAAILCESLMGCGGQIVLPKGFLPEAFDHVRTAGGVCIADEVQVGFGRVGTHFWGFETQGVVPDIVTLGKPIGNGHPLAAVVTTPEIALAFDNGMEYFNTFGGNPVSCSVGMAVLDIIEEEELQANALDTGSHLKAGLEKLMERHPLIGDVRGSGLFLGAEFVLDRETLAPAQGQAAYIIERMREHGILLSIDGPLHNVLKIKPPLVFSRKNADLLIKILDKILAEDLCKTV